MGKKSGARRRWIGAIFLMMAIGMLIAGETVLRERLQQPGWLLFWVLVIFACTCFAVLIAFLEFSVVRHRAREEQRALLENTLKDIVREKEARARQRPPPGDSG